MGVINVNYCCLLKAAEGGPVADTLVEDEDAAKEESDEEEEYEDNEGIEEEDTTTLSGDETTADNSEITVAGMGVGRKADVDAGAAVKSPELVVGESAAALTISTPSAEDEKVFTSLETVFVEVNLTPGMFPFRTFFMDRPKFLPTPRLVLLFMVLLLLLLLLLLSLSLSLLFSFCKSGILSTTTAFLSYI